MARRSNPEIDALITSLKAKGKSEQTISEIVTRRGHKITESGVHYALSRMGLAKPRRGEAAPKRKPSAARKGSTMKPFPAAPPADEGTPIERLDRAVVSLESAAKQAAADGDIGKVIQATKAVADVTALIERLRPAPATDVDDRPDVQAAAKRFREKVFDMLDRMIAEEERREPVASTPSPPTRYARPEDDAPRARGCHERV
jgi:hypothetical protein